MEAKASWVPTLVAAMLLAMAGSSHAYDFYVGGSQGWNPSESYTAWAGRNRFQVNDRLVFRYKQGEDSVLVVSEADYRACNTSSPIRKLDGGDSVFQFDRSGPFCFISGVPGRCKAGEKLAVVVLAVRGGGPKPGAPAPVPAAAPSPDLPSPPRRAPSSSPALPSPPPDGTGGPRSAAPTGAAPRTSEQPPPPGQPPSGSPPPGVPVAALALAAGATFLFM